MIDDHDGESFEILFWEVEGGGRLVSGGNA